jgi:hypothetical protein
MTAGDRRHDPEGVGQQLAHGGHTGRRSPTTARDQHALGEEDREHRGVRRRHRAQDADLAGPLDDVDRHRPGEPEAADDAQQDRHRRQEQDEHVEHLLLRVAQLARRRRRGHLHAGRLEARPDRRGEGVLGGAVEARLADDHQDARPAHLAGGPLERGVRRVQERPAGGRLDDADQRPGGVLAVDVQRHLVADREPARRPDVGGGDDRVAVGPQPASLLDRRPDRTGVRRQPERHDRAALVAALAGDLRGREPPRLGRDDARDLAGLGRQHRGPLGGRELDLDVVREVGEDVVQGLDQRGADGEHRHEDRAAEPERRKREREPALAAEGVPDRQQRGPRQAAQVAQQPVEAAVAEAVGDAGRGQRLAHRDPDARPERRRGERASSPTAPRAR